MVYCKANGNKPAIELYHACVDVAVYIMNALLVFRISVWLLPKHELVFYKVYLVSNCSCLSSWHVIMMVVRARLACCGRKMQLVRIPWAESIVIQWSAVIAMANSPSMWHLALHDSGMPASMNCSTQLCWFANIQQQPGNSKSCAEEKRIGY